MSAACLLHSVTVYAFADSALTAQVVPETGLVMDALRYVSLSHSGI